MKLIMKIILEALLIFADDNLGNIGMICRRGRKSLYNNSL